MHIIKPGASYVEVIGGVELLVKDFTKRDLVIVLAGTGEFQQGKIPKVRAIWDRIRYCTHTNLIFLCPPVVGRFAGKMYSFFQRFESFIDRVNRVSDGQVLLLRNARDARGNLWRRRTVGLVVASLDLIKHGVTGNLIFVPTVDGNELFRNASEHENSDITETIEESVRIDMLPEERNSDFLSPRVTMTVFP